MEGFGLLKVLVKRLLGQIGIHGATERWHPSSRIKYQINERWSRAGMHQPSSKMPWNEPCFESEKAQTLWLDHFLTLITLTKSPLGGSCCSGGDFSLKTQHALSCIFDLRLMKWPKMKWQRKALISAACSPVYFLTGNSFLNSPRQVSCCVSSDLFAKAILLWLHCPHLF